MNSLVASEALKRVIMRNFARRNIRSKKGVFNCTEQKGEEGDIYFLIKTSSKKKEEDARAPGGQSSGGQKKRRI